MRTRVRSFFRAEHCIFPEAITPWHKAACAATGVAVFAGTIYTGAHLLKWAATKTVGALASKPDGIMYQKKEVAVKEETPLDQAKRKKFWHIANMVTLATAPPIVVGAMFVTGYWYPKKFVKEFFIPEAKKYANIFKGTKCCDMVRATVVFNILIPLTMTMLFGSVVATYGFGLIGYTTYNEWKNFNLSQWHDDMYKLSTKIRLLEEKKKD